MATMMHAVDEKIPDAAEAAANAKFLRVFAFVFAVFLVLLGGAQLLFARIGEIGLDRVVDRELAAPTGSILFASGINQNIYWYDRTLFSRVKPEVVAIGSSRAMQMRGNFFNVPYVNMGGSVANIDDLERVARDIASAPQPHPHLAIVLFDPWWFNGRYQESNGPPPPPVETISGDMLWYAARAFYHGNWLANAFRSRNLGIFALVNNEGYARDGSFYYNGLLSGNVAPLDPHYSWTLSRIDGDHQSLEKAMRADGALLARACVALQKIRRATGHAVVIAPPFAPPIWKRLQQHDYDYIADGYSRLQACSSGLPFFDFTNPANIHGTEECEFVDGLHGGDVTYARMITQVGDRDPVVHKYLQADFIGDFTRTYQGHAGGMSLKTDPGLKETDQLRIGCRK
jgi:hypothetical protein